MGHSSWAKPEGAVEESSHAHFARAAGRAGREACRDRLFAPIGAASHRCFRRARPEPKEPRPAAREAETGAIKQATRCSAREQKRRKRRVAAERFGEPELARRERREKPARAARKADAHHRRPFSGACAGGAEVAGDPADRRPAARGFVQHPRACLRRSYYPARVCSISSPAPARLASKPCRATRAFALFIDDAAEARAP